MRPEKIGRTKGFARKPDDLVSRTIWSAGRAVTTSSVSAAAAREDHRSFNPMSYLRLSSL